MTPKIISGKFKEYFIKSRLDPFSNPPGFKVELFKEFFSRFSLSTGNPPGFKVALFKEFFSRFSLPTGNPHGFKVALFGCTFSRFSLSTGNPLSGPGPAQGPGAAC